ncbi:MAG TPA: choice-of-anchor B family protein [Longimicrobiales bacterium]|nr:choice-of-anchor B family protein [Longimicrobiales bacterium]
MKRIAAVACSLMSCAVSLHAQAGYGTIVAAGDNVMFVGEPRTVVRPGTVYAYRLSSAGGPWVEAAQIRAPNGRSGDGFGSAVAAEGTRVLIAHPTDNDGRGAAHIYEQRGQEWQHVARLAPADAAAHDSIGSAVALVGNVAVVGAARAGAVFVFRRGTNGNWTQEAKLTASDAQQGDAFGAALAATESRIVVGAPQQADRRGGAYVYDRGADGRWTETARLVARTVRAGDMLGARVALLRQYAIAAAPGRDEATGAVYLFEKNPNAAGWAAFTRLFPYEGGSNAQFGASLGVVGNELWVGSPGADGFVGTVYRFVWDEQKLDWTQARKLAVADVRPGTGYSMAVAVAGNIAIAGLPGDDQGEGTAVVLARAADGEWQPVNKVWSETEYFPAVTGRTVACQNGQASHFNCGNVELMAFLPINEIGGGRGVRLNDIWGWTDPMTNRDYALVGRTNGTSFVDVTDPNNPRYLGDLPMTPGARANAWRDIKVYRDHAYIVADGAGNHGMQVFDLARLRNVREPQQFTADATYDRIASAHNIVINEESGTAYAVGSNSGGDTCGGGLHMIDIREPKRPGFMGCFADPRTGNAGTGYSHDAQCVTYSGPDTKYAGREICFGSNETALSIADVTDRNAPVALSRASYPNVQYSHQGWLTPDQRFFYMNDEGDEVSGVVPKTRTIIWDVSDLDDPQVAGQFLGATAASDHNLYIVGDTMYQSNYASGLRIIDISDRRNPREIGFFDSVPVGDNEPGFTGSWSNYPYFRSGIIIFTSIGEGLFIVKPRRPIS